MILLQPCEERKAADCRDCHVRATHSRDAGTRVGELTSEDAATYALVRSRLERAGTPIGPLDTLIAAQAVARELTLVTNNEREFRRVPRLGLENWTR